MAELVTISATCLNQFALDFHGNFNRILQSIQLVKKDGSGFRVGPELEICGYNCEDHFLENDTCIHSWEVLSELIQHEHAQNILVDVGMPINHKGITYNCRVLFLNKKILYIRPKFVLCDDGNYRESRWFTAWTKKRYVEDYTLPVYVQKITAQVTVPIGDALVHLDDTVFGYEICEELWSPKSSHIDQYLAGAEIILNGSGSHAEIRKASYALELTKSATAKCGGVYVFCNLRGCDGERVYLNGNSSIVINGKTLALGEQYSPRDVEVLTVHFDLTEIRNYKVSIRSRSLQGDSTESYPTIRVNWSLSSKKNKLMTLPIENESFCCPEEEIARGPALWLWDYLRRSSASGFLLPLSGGIDSSSVAIIVYSMCSILCDFIQSKDWESKRVLEDIRKVLKDNTYDPVNAKDLCNRILTTAYMGSENSSDETRERARRLGVAIGSNHLSVNITSVTNALTEEVTCVFGGKKPSFSGTRCENLALQNIQARSRMVFAYFLAQMVLWSKEKNGFLLVLGSANVDEAIRGYFTKYDCSAADLNPIGGISKTDLRSFVIHAGKKFGLEGIREIVDAPPTAELTPLETNQTDEKEMGMTYSELADFGKLRKPGNCGPFSMVARLLHLWNGKHTPAEISSKVKHFYRSYAANRHKMGILTPSCHMENYSPEDHRYDLRPILYPIDFKWQFNQIDALVQKLESANEEEDDLD